MLKQIDAHYRTITKKRIMDILFEVEIWTTCVTPIQRQYSISMRPAEAQYSHVATPVQRQHSSGIEPAVAQYLNVATSIQRQYFSGTLQIQNFWMDLLLTDSGDSNIVAHKTGYLFEIIPNNF